MKISLITDHLPGYHKNWGGSEQACYRIGKLLIRDNHEISFLTTKPDRVPKENLEVHRITTVGRGYLRARIGRVLASFFAFDPIAGISSYKLFKKIKPDIVHLQHAFELSLSPVWAAKKLGIPVIFSPYDFFSICFKGVLINNQNEICTSFQGTNCFECNRLKGRRLKIFAFLYNKSIKYLRAFALRKKITDYFFDKIDAFIVPTDFWVEIFRRYGVKEEKIFVLPIPLSKEIKETKIKKVALEEGSILFVGWVYPHKGLHILIEAMASVLREVSQARLYVIETGGGEEYKNKAIDLIKKFKIEKNVIFLGKRSNEDVQSFLQRSEVVAVPEQWQISWPIFLTEAMTLEKPIVASRIGDIPFFIKDGQNGFLADPKDPEDFAQKIVNLLKEKEKANEMGKKARIDILRICDDDQILDTLKSIYNFVLRKK